MDMSSIYLESERLYIRHWELDDVDDLQQIMSDSRMHTYTGDTPWLIDRTKRYIEFMRNRSSGPYSRMHGACIRKSDDLLIGLVGFNPYLPNRPELTCQLGVPYQGLGYGTEIGLAILKAASKDNDVDSIFGMAEPHNKASIRAMEKMGMAYMGLHQYKSKQYLFYVSVPNNVDTSVTTNRYIPQTQTVRRNSA